MEQQQDGVPCAGDMFGAQSPVPQGTAWCQGASQEQGRRSCQVENLGVGVWRENSWLLVQEHPRCESSVSSVPLGAALRGSQCWAQHSPVLQQGRVARLGSPHGLALSLHSLCCQLNQGIPF